MVYAPGSVVIDDLPLAHALISTQRDRFCDGCLAESKDLSACSACRQMFYCGRSCQRRMWPAHKIECKQYRILKLLPVAQIRLLIRLLFLKDEGDKARLANLVSHIQEFRADSQFMSTFSVVLCTLSKFLSNALPTSESEIFRLYCQIQINCFTITDRNGYQIAPAIFLNAARLDHSCCPNSEYIFKERRLICLAVDEIPNITEARVNYVDPIASTEQRRSQLRSRYFFECNCSLCLDLKRDAKITSFVCCEPEHLSTVVDSASLSTTTIVCPVCHTTYDRNLIQQIIEYLSAFNDKESTVENVVDALLVYCRIRGIEVSLKYHTVVPVMDHNHTVYTGSVEAHYKLFNHKGSVYLTQVCRCASLGILPERTDDLFDTLGIRQDKELKDTVIDILIACSLDFLNWQSTYLPRLGFGVGLHASNLAGFLLRYISDSEFSSQGKMEQIKRTAVFAISESTLAHVLCRLILLADKVLTPFSLYDPTIKDGLDRLRSHL